MKHSTNYYCAAAFFKKLLVQKEYPVYRDIIQASFKWLAFQITTPLTPPIATVITNQ
jgi:hypothetical protein